MAECRRRAWVMQHKCRRRDAATDSGGTPILAELLLSLIADQPVSRDEKREVALPVLRLARRVRPAQGLSDSRRRDFLDN